MTSLPPLDIPGFRKPIRLPPEKRRPLALTRYALEPWPGRVCREPDDPGPHPWRDNPGSPNGNSHPEWPPFT